MFLKIILLGTVFLVDYAVGNCGLCQTNHVACHSENTFSLCVEGKPTDSIVRCPNGRICTDDPDICIEKYNDVLIPSCMTRDLSEDIGSFYDTQEVLTGDISKLTLDSTVKDVVSDEETATTTVNSSITEIDEGDISSDVTVDPTVAEVSDGVVSTTTYETSTTDSQEGGDIVFSTEDSNTSTDDTTVSNEEISQTTQDLESTTESSELSSSSIQDVSSSDISSTTDIIDTSSSTPDEISQITEDLVSTTESSEQSSSSTQDVSSGDIFSTTDIIETSTNAPRDATTFCSENKDIGTYKAEGDTTCKRYYVCTTSSNDGFKGYEFMCDGNTYFNSEISLCQREKPEDC